MPGKTLIEKPTRRDFFNQILSAGTLILGASLLPGESPVGRASFRPNVFLGLETDGTVYVVAHRSEMGNGAKTALPRIVADEMDADWKRVKIIQADANPAYGSQMTVASHSILEFFHPMRELGATARLMLIEAAAHGWSVPVEECDSALQTVIHKPTQRSKSFGELAAAAALLPLPGKDKLRLKSRNRARYCAFAQMAVAATGILIVSPPVNSHT